MIGATEVARVRDALIGGGLAIVPTDTVYGLAAALDSARGIDALYTLKGRPLSQPCQVLVFTEPLLAEALAPLDEVTARVVRALLPGPATCIVPDPTGRYVAATGDQPGAVGVRAPRMDGAILALDIPLVATSANDPGGPEPLCVDDVPDRMLAAVTGIVDHGRLGPRSSTVVDLRALPRAGPARLLRVGPDIDAIVRTLADLGIAIASPSPPLP